METIKYLFHALSIHRMESKKLLKLARSVQILPQRTVTSISGYKISLKVHVARPKRSNHKGLPAPCPFLSQRFPSFSLENGASRYPASLVKGHGTTSCSTGTLSVHSVYLPILGVSTRENVLYTYIQRRLSRRVTEVKPGWCPR